MSEFGDVLAQIWAPFARLATPESSLYWLYLLSAATIAFVYYWSRRLPEASPSFTGFLEFVFPKRIYTHPSARLDFKYFAVNTLLFGLFVGPFILTSAAFAGWTVSGLVALFGPPAAPLPSNIWVNLGATVAVVVASDLGFFAVHYLEHRIPFLWEFHKVHHAAEVLHPVTLYRAHPVDTALDVTFMAAASGGVLGVLAYVCDNSLEGVTILGINAAVFVFNFAGVHLKHSHVRLSYGPIFNRVFISPVLHQVHHGKSPRHFGKNLGGLLAIWDWLAGTLYLPRADEEMDVGLPGGEEREYASLTALYLLPLKKNAALVQQLFTGSFGRRLKLGSRRADEGQPFNGKGNP